MKRIKELADSGLEVHVGRHIDLRGYWATVAECGDYCRCGWADSGHGMSIEEALTDAIRVSAGEAPQFLSEDFEELGAR